MVLATQDLPSGESLSQPNFRLFAVIDRNRAGNLAFKYHARSWLRDVPQMFNGHAVAPPRVVGIRCLDPMNETCNGET